jgi:hypothetical protein
MKIIEVIMGQSGTDTLVVHPPDNWKNKKKHSDNIPQVGYGIKIGNKIIPTPQQPNGAEGTNDSVVGG